MNTAKRSSILALLLTGGALVTATAAGETLKVSAAPSPPQLAGPKLTLHKKSVSAPGALTTTQRAAVKKAVQAAVAAFARDRNPAKVYASRQGLTGVSAKSFRTQMATFLSANAAVASRYSIEDSLVSLESKRQGGTCTNDFQVALLLQNKLGGDFPADKPTPSLEVWQMVGGGFSLSPIVTAPLPRLASKQSQWVRFTLSRSSNWDSDANGCKPVLLDMELNLLGVAVMGVYTLSLGDGGATLESYPLGTNPNSGNSDFPGGYPDGCDGWQSCYTDVCASEYVCGY